ncbi:MAG: four-carbon acid sugar kinase family protein [Xenococcaceae cyanobacterium]
MTTNKPKIIVLDDDPTGSQTVHSCLLLMRWDIDTLRLGLTDDAPIFFILTNTRALPPEQAQQVTREVCRNLKEALSAEKIEDFLIVSRSDSTLRGHYPLETDVIAEEIGKFDAHFLIPAFFEGGRVTKNSIHYLIIDGVETPVHQTEFARDSVFGYQYSYLPDYVEEKTKGKITADRVERFLLSDLRAVGTGLINSVGNLQRQPLENGHSPLQDRLMNLSDDRCAVVDAEVQADLDNFAEAVLAAASKGKKFLFRSAASWLTSLAKLGKQPVAPESMSEYKPTSKPGIVLVGSHVNKTTQQLEKLLEESTVVGIEVDVAMLRDCPEKRNEILATTLERVYSVYLKHQTPVIYTNRQELNFASIQERLDFGVAVSSVLMDLVKGLPKDIGFLISKGGITSNDVLSTGLTLRAARLLGQILPGVSLVCTPSYHPLFPNLPVVLFPGNVGDRKALATVYNRLLNN